VNRRELSLDLNHQRHSGAGVGDPADGHRRQSHQQLAHARSIGLHRVLFEMWSSGLDTHSLAGPLCCTYNPCTPLISEEPDYARWCQPGDAVTVMRCG
jgi:hypothetical protein